MSIEEQGIFHTQAKAASEQLGGKDGLRELQKRGVFYLDERIYVYLLALAAAGLCVVWATASSVLVLYGSFGLVIVLTLLWGVARVRGIDSQRRERELQARTFEAGKLPPDSDG
jgi:hypothetical protein